MAVCVWVCQSFTRDLLRRRNKLYYLRGHNNSAHQYQNLPEAAQPVVPDAAALAEAAAKRKKGKAKAGGGAKADAKKS